MRVIVFGATGALGSHLLPLLNAAGHTVTGVTRFKEKLERLKLQGCSGIALDALDREAVRAAVSAAQPEAIIHQLTAIPQQMNLRRIDRDFELTNRLRTEGTDHILAAAAATGVKQVIAQSFGGWTYQRSGQKLSTESDPLDPDPPKRMRHILDAIRHLERAVLSFRGGLVLRYAAFYGPGTSLARAGAQIEALRMRKFPIVGRGSGVWSFVHVTDAAAATLRALDANASGLYNVADNDPAPVSEWLPYLAETVGANPPAHVPSWLARILIGPHAVTLMNEIGGISNEKIKRDLHWEPKYASWREGFRIGLG